MSGYYHCPKCGKNWSHAATHPGCDATPQEMRLMVTVSDFTLGDFINIVLSTSAEVAGMVILWLVDYRLFVATFLFTVAKFMGKNSFLRGRAAVLKKLHELR